jgi:hypothetical protein
MGAHFIYRAIETTAPEQWMGNRFVIAVTIY